MDQVTPGHGYSIPSSDKHKILLNRLAQKSGLGEMSSAAGISSNNLIHNNNLRHHLNDGGSSEIIWSEQPGYQNHFGGIVRLETSPQSKKVSQGDNWNLSPISS